MSVSSVYAQGLQDLDITSGFSIIGEFLSGIFQNEYAVFGLTVVFSFLILYSVIGAGLKHIKIFEGEGGLGLNAAGKMFTFAVAGISTISFFTVYREQTVSFVPNFLGGIGIYLAVFIGLVVFLLIFRSLKDRNLLGVSRWKPSLFIAGICLWWIGSASRSGGAIMVGFLFTIAAALAFLFGISKVGIKKLNKDKNVERDIERDTQGLQQEAQTAREEVGETIYQTNNLRDALARLAPRLEHEGNI